MSLDPAIKTKIDQLVAQDPVVLFMKGTRSFPQCGFSASVVNILNTLIPKYTTVNILADADIRGGMKEYSDWPTFPQLFIRGEFIGGADIVRQMHESGDLEKKLGDLVAAPKTPSLTVSARAANPKRSPATITKVFRVPCSPSITPSFSFSHSLRSGGRRVDGKLGIMGSHFGNTLLLSPSDPDTLLRMDLGHRDITLFELEILRDLGHHPSLRMSVPTARRNIEVLAVKEYPRFGLFRGLVAFARLLHDEIAGARHVEVDLLV